MSSLRLSRRTSSILCSWRPGEGSLPYPDTSCLSRLTVYRGKTWRPRIPRPGSDATTRCIRQFSATATAFNWLQPSAPEKKSKSKKGRPRVHTGGSMRGTTVVWGDFGLRMRDHDRRISAMQLKNAEETLRRRLRGMNYKLYSRVCANIAVYAKGGEVRMGKGKGKFDHWATRIPVSRIVLELKGDMHEKVIQEAFRLAANKLPGIWETVKKGDPPVVGITKLGNGVTLESLRRARREIPGAQVESDSVISPATDTPPASISTAA